MANFDLGAVVAAPVKTNPADIFGKVLQGGRDYYGFLTELNTAKYNAQLAKANAKSAVAVAKAGGYSAVEQARAGNPSSSLLMVGGLGLLALLVLKK